MQRADFSPLCLRTGPGSGHRVFQRRTRQFAQGSSEGARGQVVPGAEQQPQGRGVIVRGVLPGRDAVPKALGVWAQPIYTTVL